MNRYLVVVVVVVIVVGVGVVWVLFVLFVFLWTFVSGPLDTTYIQVSPQLPTSTRVPRTRGRSHVRPSFSKK